MIVTINTEPTVEPVSLTELKEHMKVDSGSIDDAIAVEQSLAPDSRAVANYTGTGVDRLGYNTLVILDCGTAVGTLNAHIEESDDDGTYTDWTGGTFDEVTAANDNQAHEIEYTGTKQYVRVYAAVTDDVCDFSATVIKQSPTSQEDTYIIDLGKAARKWVEQICGRVLITQTWDYYLNRWPDKSYIKVPFPPLGSVTHVKYTEDDATENTWTASNYIVDTDSEPGRIVLNDYVASSFPTENLYASNAINVRFVAGYGATGASVPEGIKQAIKIVAAEQYEMREPMIVGTLVQRYMSLVKGLIMDYRIWDTYQ